MPSTEHHIDDRTGLETLDAATCWRLLRAGAVGRLAVIVGHQPDIFPVNYLVHDDAVLIRTAPGTKLAAAVLGGRVAFEIDQIDEEAETGWSVVVHGPASEVEALEGILSAEDSGLRPWVGATRERWVRIAVDELSGRRVPAH